MLLRLGLMVTNVSLKEGQMKAVQAAIICELVVMITDTQLVAPRNCISMGQEV